MHDRPPCLVSTPMPLSKALVWLLYGGVAATTGRAVAIGGAQGQKHMQVSD